MAEKVRLKEVKENQEDIKFNHLNIDLTRFI